MPQKLGRLKVHFLPSLRIQDNAKFSISFVLKYLLGFSLQNDILIYYMAEISGKL